MKRALLNQIHLFNNKDIGSREKFKYQIWSFCDQSYNQSFTQSYDQSYNQSHNQSHNQSYSYVWKELY